MISHLVAIELCETTCLSALFFKKRCQMGSIAFLRNMRYAEVCCNPYSIKLLMAKLVPHLFDKGYMFQTVPFCGIIVDNAQPELLEWHHNSPQGLRYVAKSHFASGILEGLEYFGLLRGNQGLPMQVHRRSQ